MDSLNRYLLIAAVLLLASLALSSTTVVQAVVDKTTSVFVTNDSAHAVPVNVMNLPAVQQVSGSVAVSNFPATQQVAGTVNTVGRAPSELVTLVHLALSNAGYLRQFPNGASDSSDFAIPPGKVLVITDINVTFRRGPGDAGKTAGYFLQSIDATAGSAVRARLQTTLNGEAQGGAAQHYETGIVFASTAALYDNLSGGSFDVAELRGYLADDN
jgi:hypothetical protein